MGEGVEEEEGSISIADVSRGEKKIFFAGRI